MSTNRTTPLDPEATTTTRKPAADLTPGDIVCVGRNDWRAVRSTRRCGDEGRSIALVFAAQANGAPGGYRTYLATRRVHVAADAASI